MNTMKNRDLWRAIEAFDIDGGPAELTFEARLARENGWKREFAARVIAEYRRFVFLAVSAGHPVTPSDEIDQAWHLHMTYTRSYWDRLCGGVLKKPLHHDPTRGGRNEGTKFEDWYSRTRDTYTRIFGEAPPRDVWPDASVRFGDAPHFARINTRRYWVIRKPRSWRTAAAAAGLAGVAIAMTGCVATLGNSGLNTAVLIIAGIIALVLMYALAVNLGRRGDHRAKRRGDGCGGGFWWWGSGSGSSPDDDPSGCGSSGCGSSGCGGGCGGGGD